jgi:hypothetical protein
MFHSVIAEEEGLFTFEDVAKNVLVKMVRRHPHVFWCQRTHCLLNIEDTRRKMNTIIKEYLIRYLIYIVIGMTLYLLYYITHRGMMFIPSYALLVATTYFADYLFQDWLHKRFGKAAFFITVIVLVVGYIIGVKITEAISDAVEGWGGMTALIIFFMILFVYVSGYLAYEAEVMIRKFFTPR